VNVKGDITERNGAREMNGELAREDVSALLDLFLSGRRERTIRAYKADLADFMKFLQVVSIQESAVRFLKGSHGQANALAYSYRGYLINRGLQPSTINRRLSALRSLAKLARTVGLIPWSVDVENVRGWQYRDTRGPGREGYRELLVGADAEREPMRSRDIAILHLLYDLALKRESVSLLDMDDVDVEDGVIAVSVKGREEQEIRTLPDETRAVIRQWIAVRGDHPGPVFVNFDRARKGDGRLSGTSIYRIVSGLGKRVGVTARPHGLRHAAITEALDLTGGDVRAVARFSGHRKIETLMIYDDNRQDIAGDVARLVASNTSVRK